MDRPTQTQHFLWWSRTRYWPLPIPDTDDGIVLMWHGMLGWGPWSKWSR